MRLRLHFLPFSALVLMAASGAAQEGASRHVWSDFDGDGLPDLYVAAPGRDDVLLRNAGDGSFVDATQAAGLAGQRSAAVRPGDFDRDELADLLLLSEDGELRLFRGLDGGAFLEAAEAGIGLQGAADAEWVDYDQDGWVDLKAETESGEPVLFHNVEGLFERIELGLETPVINIAGGAVVTPLMPPIEVADQTPSLGGRIPVSGSGSGSGKQSLRTPPDVSIAIGGDVETSLIDLVCSEAVRDASNRSECIQASSNPTMGMLYPLSSNRYIDPATGFVGLGTTNPATRLDVAGAAMVRGGLTVSGSALDVLDFRLRLFETGSGIATVYADPTGANNGGQIVLRTDDNFPTIELGGDAGNDEGLMILRDANSASGVSLRGRDVFGSGEGGAVIVFNTAGQATGRLVADSGSDSGRLELRNENGANSHVGVSLNASNGANAGELLLQNNFGGTVVTLRANDGINATNTSRLQLNEHDGSQAFSMSNDTLQAYGSSGGVNFSVNRHSGDVAQSLNGFGAVKAACRVDGTGSATVTSEVNGIPGAGNITVLRQAVGVYRVFIGTADVSNRFYQATNDPSGGVIATVSARPSFFANNQIEVSCFDPVSGNFVDSDFYLLVY